MAADCPVEATVGERVAVVETEKSALTRISAATCSRLIWR